MAGRSVCGSEAGATTVGDVVRPSVSGVEVVGVTNGRKGIWVTGDAERVPALRGRGVVEGIGASNLTAGLVEVT